MALTNDEINEILELYGRGYSGRKIAEKTGHSDVTVYSYIHQAKEQVTKLIKDGMDTDQILSQLDYPVSFVNRVIRETGSNQITNEKDESKVEESAEEFELSHGVDIKVEYDNFNKDLELAQHKDNMLERVEEFLEALRISKERFKQRNILDGEFQKRQSALESKLTDFVLDKIDDVDSMDVLSDLEIISEEVFSNINVLINEYNIKADQVEEARKAQEKASEEDRLAQEKMRGDARKVLEKARIAKEKAREEALSDELLNRLIDIPMFPDFVKKGVRSKFLVRFPYESPIIRDALFEINLEIIQEYGFSLDHNEEAWQAYLDKIISGGVDYMKKMAATYEQGTVNSLVSINVCPSCESRLIKKYVEGKIISSCNKCGKAWETLQKVS